ncbi:hypothetical protein Taro_015282 [Colocasia esculenta]|uniref:Uncharacterized protein n=1 Tax=Colocasia esculenta TaxID=4460 RepID=A0A843ULX3_COLES|nr:hypothetical protein [Colocasia esculenta]
MAVGVFHSVTALVAACSRQVSRMSKKLLSSGSPRSIDVDRAKIAPSWAPYLSRRVSLIPFLGGGNKKASAETPKGKKKKNYQKRTLEEEEEEEEEEDYEDAEDFYGDEEREDAGEGVWKKTILMGEKCQPLDFSGVIYYDNEGRRLQELPPRSPMRSPLPSFSFPVVIASDKGVTIN